MGFISINLLKPQHENQSIVANKILEDFIQFKDKNELKYCTLHQSKQKDGAIEVTWNTTVRYNNLDLEKIKQDFKLFCEENSEEICQMSKVTCQDNVYVVEYITYNTYCIRQL